jgi:hypothetical protein
MKKCADQHRSAPLLPSTRSSSIWTWLGKHLTGGCLSFRTSNCFGCAPSSVQVVAIRHSNKARNCCRGVRAQQTESPHCSSTTHHSTVAIVVGPSNEGFGPTERPKLGDFLKALTPIRLRRNCVDPLDEIRKRIGIRGLQRAVSHFCRYNELAFILGHLRPHEVQPRTHELPFEAYVRGIADAPNSHCNTSCEHANRAPAYEWPFCHAVQFNEGTLP